ncbi:AMP-binding enzyme C-terminal domain-containing protein [Antarctobacter heliothermus]|uniref:AMP-binding enzyme C-terminal domain-containing protein n=1 Tax=Antarctobacter heliothermus TaxID=74033 RepID=A0A239FUT7_9RHOB|nr:AMP-binding enzyme C-terminal domain-containing protein [Antarctobacter heliothermus]
MPDWKTYLEKACSRGALGRIDEDSYVSIVGRQKDLIISGGHNIYQNEIEALLEALRPQLARFKHPRSIRLLDELPRNTVGKVQKNLLRDDFAAQPA